MSMTLEALLNIDRQIVRTFPRLAKWIKEKLLWLLTWMNENSQPGHFREALTDQVTDSLNFVEEVILEDNLRKLHEKNRKR